MISTAALVSSLVVVLERFGSDDKKVGIYIVFLCRNREICEHKYWKYLISFSLIFVVVKVFSVANYN